MLALKSVGCDKSGKVTATWLLVGLYDGKRSFICIGIFVQNIVWIGIWGLIGASLGDFSRLWRLQPSFRYLHGPFGFKISMDVFSFSCLFSWSPSSKIQGKCLHMWAKYFNTSKAWTKKMTAVWYGSGAVNSHTLPDVWSCHMKAPSSKLGVDKYYCIRRSSPQKTALNDCLRWHSNRRTGMNGRLLVHPWTFCPW